MGHYDRLTALDASFLGIEDENAHMHVAVALLLERGALGNAAGGVDAEKVRAYVESRLHLIPRYRQKLAFTPLERHPVWVDDSSFNIFYHVRHTSLPRPGDERQLKRLCGRILSQKLDHTKPLWEIWIVEGLSSGRFALIAKAHHCMVDGISGVDLLSVVLSPESTTSFDPGPQWQPRPEPSDAQLVAGEAWRRLTLSFGAARVAAGALVQPRQAVSTVLEQAAGLAEVVSESFVPASETPLNPASIGPHRRFDWLRIELEEVKRVRRALGGTVNDVVLAIVVGAVRRFLERRGIDPVPLDFRAMIPVSVRRDAEHGALGNKVAQMVARLPLDELDPHKRLARVCAVTTELKHSAQVPASELFADISDWTATGLLTQMLRIATNRRAYNLIVTNVPGPQIPLFLLGAPLCETYPMVPLFQNQALGIALFSYVGSLFWGLNADWDAVPDLHEMVNDLRDSHAELLAAARPIELRARAGGQPS